MEFRYRVVFVNRDGRRKMCDCAHSFTIAKTVAQKHVVAGDSEVVIQVLSEDGDPDDDSWPPIDVTPQ